jgi:hypothetical protein
MAHLIVAEEGKLKKFEITEDFLFIGRTSQNHIRISDPDASGQHCQIIKTEKGFRLIDLGSQTGTYLRGKKVKQADLSEGDVIRIGSVKIAIKEIGAAPAAGGTPAASAGASAPAGAAKRAPAGAARRPGARTAARRAGGRAAAARGEKATPQITIRKDMAEASARGGHMVRRNLRKGSKIPGWAMGIIAFWVIVVAVVVIYYVVVSSSSQWGDVYNEGLTLWHEKQNHEAAFAKFESIPIEDPVYGEKSREMMAEIVKEREAGNIQYDSINAGRNYEHNIKLFIHVFLDAPPDKPSYARKIKREYAPDRASYIRVLLKDRINPFIERFPNTPQIAEVKELQRKYSREVNLDKTPSFRDVEIDASCKLNLSGFGEAYQVMAQWLAANPNTEMRDRADWTFRTIWNRLQEEWRIRDAEISRNEAAKKPAYAIKKLDRMLKLTEGLDSPEGRKFRSDLEKRKAKNVARLEVLTGSGS